MQLESVLFSISLEIALMFHSSLMNKIVDLIHDNTTDSIHPQSKRRNLQVMAHKGQQHPQYHSQRKETGAYQTCKVIAFTYIDDSACGAFFIKKNVRSPDSSNYGHEPSSLISVNCSYKSVLFHGKLVLCLHAYGYDHGKAKFRAP